jgi:hypothetical protein
VVGDVGERAGEIQVGRVRTHDGTVAPRDRC